MSQALKAVEKHVEGEHNVETETWVSKFQSTAIKHLNYGTVSMTHLGRVERGDDPHAIGVVVVLDGVVGGRYDTAGPTQVRVTHPGCGEGKDRAVRSPCAGMCIVLFV